MSTLEQSFNPDWDDITRRENFGQYNFFIYFLKDQVLPFSFLRRLPALVVRRPQGDESGG